MTRRNPPLSEREAWSEVARMAAAIRADRTVSGIARDYATKIAETAKAMGEQVRRGIHQNPPLTVFAINPPAGAVEFGDRLYTIEYHHKQKKHDYYHDFKPGTVLVALPSGDVLIHRKKGTGPVARDFVV